MSEEWLTAGQLLDDAIREAAAGPIDGKPNHWWRNAGDDRQRMLWLENQRDGQWWAGGTDDAEAAQACAVPEPQPWSPLRHKDSPA